MNCDDVSNVQKKTIKSQKEHSRSPADKSVISERPNNNLLFVCSLVVTNNKKYVLFLKKNYTLEKTRPYVFWFSLIIECMFFPLKKVTF